MNCANHLDREKVAFCQNCGKPLCQECTRAVGAAVYCEPCLAAKLAAAAAPPVQPGAYSYSDPASGVNVSGTAAGGSYTYSNPASGVYASGVIPPAPPMGAPNPALAAFLGFIPGVGAMYNEQYAKGVVHLVVFAILVSLADANGIFGLFVAGWEFYMAFEAYHTARARRDGLPLPNPFGLNELGQKLGFEKGWHSPAPAPSSTPPDPYTAPYTPPPAAGTVPNAAPSYGYAPGYAPSYAPGYVPPYTPSGTATPGWGTPEWNQYNPPMPPPPVPLDEQVPYPGNRFPAGALWLIGLGALFLLGNAGIFHGFSSRLFMPFLLIGLGVFIFVRKMTSSGYGLTGDGSADYRYRLVRALRGSVWVALVGLLFFLNDFHILSWGHSWPLFIILAGVMTVLQRAAYTPAPIPPYGYGYPPPPTATAPSAAPVVSTETALTPTPTNTEEGR
jgi:TM2 domain-containing membrane protein YozV